MPLAYELVADSGVLSSAITQYNFTDLNFNKDDVLMLVSNTIGNNALGYLGVNGDTTVTNYYSQLIQADSVTISSARSNNNQAMYFFSGSESQMISHIKLTENGYFTYQSKITYKSSASNIRLVDIFGTKTEIVSSITQINILASIENGIGIGSQFKLYKLVANPVVDIIVDADATQIDIIGLSLDTANELLLIFDVENNSGANADYSLFLNEDYTASNYYNQLLSVSSTTRIASRNNEAKFAQADNGLKTLVITNLKLTNSGYFASQSHETKDVGGTLISLRKIYNAKTTTVESITSLRILSNVSNGIKAGSRVKLYKLK